MLISLVVPFHATPASDANFDPNPSLALFVSVSQMINVRGFAGRGAREHVACVTQASAQHTPPLLLFIA
ncbi:hypothetical protein EVAR_70396_1 [Eumeta japonica]|uniref:Uncharacterized protein n=1 Tax=Eumeta variegata TaxID=151549 RepID=A0A4C1SPK8_EUMVA|nr:hypothetical protein EVAR_70396_1 [Eumeta japonica]